MLYHSRYTGEGEVYFQQVGCRLDGDLDAAAFERAWQQVLDRHTALRTSFHWRELERPLQVVHKRVAVPFVFEDWRGLAAVEQAERLERVLEEDRRRGFDLARPPLLRLTLCRLAEDRWELVWSFHHLLFDGWSMPLVIREVLALYAAARRGEPLELPRPRPYRDFILWLQRQDLAAAEAFWRGALAGFAAPTPLVLGAPPAAALDGGDPVGRAYQMLGGPLLAAVQDFGRRRGLTLSTLVQGAWAVLLARSAGSEDVAFGVTSAGRPADLPGSSDMVGMFINTLPVRLRVPSAGAVLPWLQDLQGLELRMREHEHSPLVRIQGWSEVPRGVPLFESIVVFEGFAVETSIAGSGGGVSIAEVRHVQKTNFPLALNVSPQGAGLRLRLTYDRRRFAGADAVRALAHLEVLLAAMVADPERRLGGLPLLTAGERHQLQVEWNDVPGGGMGGEGVAGLWEKFAAQAARTPAALAVVQGEARLTYGDLAGRAGEVGRRLRRLGVGPGDRVGLALERSPELVVGLLGIVAAGGAYVPIDPAYPAERRDFMRRDAGLAAVVDREWLGAVGAGDGTVAAEAAGRGSAAPRAQVEREPRDFPGREGGFERPLYAIYTSGSTGQPKGAVVYEGAFSGLVDWYVGELGLSAGDRHLLLSSPSFDLTQKNFFAPLLVGAELHLAPAAYDPAGLRALIERVGITGLNCTPSAFHPLVEEGDPAALASLRNVVLGGEAIVPGRLERWRRSASGRAAVLNSYGPTECTDVVAFHRLASPDGDVQSTVVPLGRPIPGARLWIASGLESGEPAPIGVPGELWIGGSCVGGGYLGDPVRTAMQFAPDPYLDLPGVRAYRTGDLARRLPGGEIEYLGRIDQQVKVRGFRIEPGEVEAALTAHPAVREAAVAVRGEALVAYVVGRDGAAPSDSDLRSYLATRLPEPLVPALFVSLESLPLTPSGKVDRRALPEPGHLAARKEREAAPAGPLESYLAGLFRDVLKLGEGVEVGAEDDFFALGGHSIAAAVLINRLQEKLGALLYAVALFDAPTVSRLAAYLVENDPEAVARVFGEEALGGAAARLAPVSPRIDRALIAELRRAIVPLPARMEAGARNPPAVFVLSPPRSGSTLLRVMLAGHPRLFAPPELELLSFHTLAERRAAFPGRNAFWLEGTVRAVMEVRGLSAEEAAAEIGRLEAEGGTTRELYRRLQAWIGDRTLVDKTPSYALDRAVLARAEEVFERARYIHLLRHPFGMIHSFEEAKLDEVFFRHPHSLSRRELAELIWVVSQENILDFLAGVPRERQLQVRFEDLLARPVPVLEEICGFLGLAFDPAMAEPYRGEARMTDGIHAWSRMLGDVKFLQHGRVDPAVAGRWREGLRDLVPGEETLALAGRLGYEVEPLAARGAIPRRPAGLDPVPLSYSQERLWFIDQLQPGSSAYNLPAAVRLRGKIDVAAFHGALAEVVRRHESLRTTFGFAAGQDGPVQRIAPALAPPLPRIDLQGLPPGLRESEVRRLARSDARRPFDLAAGPLFRAALIAVSGEPAEHVALLNLHHIVADGHSVGVLIRELTALYGALVERQAPPLPPLPVQYPDFALWQRTWLTGEVLAAQTAYWTEALRGTPVLDLPTDLPRPPLRTERGGVVRRLLPSPLAAGLSSLAEREKATRFMVLLAGWGALLSRHTGQTDLAVGIPVANRTRPEVEGLIGFFVNTLVLRLDLAGAPGFPVLVARARRTALGAYAHQDLPFEKVVEAVQPPRDTSRSPLFQVMLAFQGEAVQDGPVALPGLTLEPLQVDSANVKFDLTLSVQEAPGGTLALRAGYRADLFLAPTVARHLAHLEALLAAGLADPDAPFNDLPLLAPAERHQLLAEWNDTAGPVPPGPGLYELFAAAAAARPDAPAVLGPWAPAESGGAGPAFSPPGPTPPGASPALGASEPSQGGPHAPECRPASRGSSPETRVLTYGELASQVDLLAARLAALGVGPEVRVGVLLPRTPEAVTAILAVLAAGGAYLPLDPSHPPERRAFQLRDAGAALLITRRDLLAAFPEAAVPALCLDDLPADAPPSTKRQPTDSGQLAYVLYTSGSTGVPSGVSMPHRGAINLVADARRRLAVGPGNRVLQLAPLGFDVSVAELFVPLASGAALCLVGDEARRDPALLAAALASLEIDRAFVTPAFFTALPDGATPDLRASVGGEAFTRELAQHWAPGRQLFNNYGPTEAAVYATSRRVDPEALPPWGGPSVGGPIPGVRAHLLDPHLQPVPLGAAGEICLGGAALARGYAGRPDKTAERFVPDPFADRPGERLYRTGDLARRLPSGEIDFLGRIDGQVKVRGFRIEPGEIEAALLRHPAVRQAAVLVRGTAAEERHLAAFVGIDGGANEPAPDPAELRRFLAAALPEPMVPAVFVVLPELPVTPNGKIDRRALDALESSADRPSGRAPETPAERFLAPIWEDVLGRTGIGADDDFFALGGTSLQAAILIRHLERRLGAYVYVVALFDAPTLAGLARYLEHHYAEAVARATGSAAASPADAGPPGRPANGEPADPETPGTRITDSDLRRFLALIPPLPSRSRVPRQRPRRALFVLSPPRSGSTLLRVLLAGHPDLFAPPELELLGFNSLGERRAAFNGRYAFWAEGLVRALMELDGAGAVEAAATVAAWEERDLSVREVYAELEGRLGGRLLVDKTPSYALDPAILARAEEDFEEPLYLHLLRHPHGMIRSFEQARLEQVFFRPPHDYSRRVLAELIWLASQRHILAHLERVPAGRRLTLRFEDLVQAPEPALRRVAAFLRVPFHPALLDPYEAGGRRMTDGVHALSKMLGDVKFHEHKAIDPAVAESWRESLGEDFLGEPSWQLAEALGYPRIDREEPAARAAPSAPGHTSPRRFLVPLVPPDQAGPGRPLFLVHPAGGDASCYAGLARRLGPDRPVYGLLSPPPPAGGPAPTVEERAAAYAEALDAAQPEGGIAVGGWSSGGVTAWETARQLRRRGREVELVLLLDSHAPDPASPRRDQAEVLAGIAANLDAGSGRPAPLTAEELRPLPEAERIARLFAAARDLGRLPPGLDEQEARDFLRAGEADVEAVRAYEPGPAAGPVLLVRADRGTGAADRGWGALAGRLEVQEVDASHSGLLVEPALTELTELLRERLREGWVMPPRVQDEKLGPAP